jgi:hypothetical protein
MSNPQSPNEAIRSLLFRKAEVLNKTMLQRLTDAAGHLSSNEDRAVIGALAGMEVDIGSMRRLMTLVRDCFQTENLEEESHDR